MFLMFIYPVFSFGQISQGGIPVEIRKLKSASPLNDLVVMPEIDNQKLRAENNVKKDGQIKPYRFAHSFDVALTPENSGKWYFTNELNVWQLRIRSAGAYSLNLVFDQFRLPTGSRLFIINQATGEIKGAYTADNNSESRIFPVEPVAGDELLVQYEEPVQVEFSGKFRIKKVAHDFIGIVARDPRIPLGLSGACNLNVNCDIVNGSEEVRDAVCRIIIDGTELCTGTLVNNTAQDYTPYLLTAYHCISNDYDAQASVFLFNFESPYCSSIIGDVTRSLSGSSLKSSFDSLDFSLVRINSALPYNYRTFLSGWNRKNLPPASSICIHHPLGDVKKVAIDQNAAVTAKFNLSYHSKGFWNIIRWEYGVTEQGSSGGPLFDQNKQLVGTLTGGAATCSVPTNDYFEKFALSWDYRKETNKQLKFWLDPINSGVEKISGMYSYSGKQLCKPFTNFKNSDTHAAIQITNGLTKKGYFSGTNLAGFTDFAEQFKLTRNCEVQGVTLGIAKLKTNAAYANSYIDVKIYSGSIKPEMLLYSEKFDLKKLWADGMNYLPFKTSVKTVGSFFVAYNIEQMHEGDTLAVYMADRKSDVTNSFFLKNQTGWLTYNSQNLNGNGSSLLMELIACNVDDPQSVKDLKNDMDFVRVYPNPLQGSSVLHVQAVGAIECPEDIAVYDLLGKKQDVMVTTSNASTINIDFSGKRFGIYFVQYETGGKQLVSKIAYIP